MSEGKKASFASLRAGLARATAKAAAVQGQATMLAREAITTGEAIAGGFAAGFANQKFGAVDKETGIKVHKTNGVPTVLLASMAVKGAAALNVFGEFSRDAFAVSTGSISSWSSDAGRASAIRLEARDLKRQSEIKVETKEAKAVNG